MKLYLISNDISQRGRWMGVFSAMKPETFAALSLDIENNCIIFISDTMIKNLNDTQLKDFFLRRVMILSMVPNYAEAQRFLGLGAMGYGNAMMHKSHLYSAYQALEEGKVWLHPDFITLMISQIRDSAELKESSSAVLDELSKREREVAIMLGDGATHQKIADDLHITVRTVKAHATAIYQKMGVKDRLALSILLHR